jgi:hypothetical protein
MRCKFYNSHPTMKGQKGSHTQCKDSIKIIDCNWNYNNEFNFINFEGIKYYDFLKMIRTI